MLIVNADDFGAAPSATDAILTAWEAGAISSASAMVWMPDSARAGRLARTAALPLGLHLNLTLPFTGDDPPPEARERQALITAAFEPDSWWDDELVGVQENDIRAAVDDQLAQYRDQYGEPTHINGHHHVHVHRQVLELLPRDVPIRPIMRTPGEARRRLSPREDNLRHNFETVSLALSFSDLHPDLGGSGFRVLERCSERCPIEVMTHPQQRRELDALLSEEWLSLIAGYPLGSYADLKVSRSGAS